jgi:hypothetical protein
MRRLALVAALALLAAGCGGSHAGSRHVNTGSRPVTKPLGRPVVATLKGSIAGSAQLRAVSDKRTAVNILLKRAAPKGVTAELAKGSCGTPKGLQTLKPLGKVSGRGGSWSVTSSLTQLTASALAVVVRRGGAVAGCGNVPQA